jgi:hypothetical protein
MALSICHRASCDHPKCRRFVMVPHARARDIREHLKSISWELVRWRTPTAGRREYRGRRITVDDTGGSGRILHLCPWHGGWRPDDGGEERPLPSLPRMQPLAGALSEYGTGEDDIL